MKLIDGWRRSWRLWSVRLGALGTLLSTFALAFPDAALGVWNSLPAEARAAMPFGLPMLVPTFLFAATTIARVVKQEKHDG